MKVTINQIADMARVSKGTVSKVLNGHPGIGEDTRRRVLALVERLDYHPDASARALARQRTDTIGLLIPQDGAVSLADHYWPAALAGISRAAAERGLGLMVFTLAREGDLAGALAGVLKRQAVDGLIVGSELLDGACCAMLTLRKLPFVLLGQHPDFAHYCVDIDSVRGSALMVDHMAAMGYRAIAGLFGPAAYPYNRDRAATYRRRLADHGLAWSAAVHAEAGAGGARAALSRLLDERPGLDALFVGAGGRFFLECLEELRRRRVDPGALGLGVYDDYPYLDFLSPRVSAVAQPTAEAGRAAVELLARLVAGEAPAERLVSLAPRLVVRESCGEARRT